MKLASAAHRGCDRPSPSAALVGRRHHAPFPTPGAPADRGRAHARPDAAMATPSSGTALALRGAPYRNGGIDPRRLRLQRVRPLRLRQHGVAMPRQAREQFRIGKRRSARTDLAPGDLVFFSTDGAGRLARGHRHRAAISSSTRQAARRRARRAPFRGILGPAIRRRPPTSLNALTSTAGYRFALQRGHAKRCDVSVDTPGV